jgi:hypothetical protein
VPPPALPGSAAECFNPQLFEVGTTYQLDYQLPDVPGSPGGTTSDRSTVQASADTGPQDRLVVTDHEDHFLRPVPGYIVTRLIQRKLLQSIDGVDILTKSETETFPTLVATTTYQPVLRDARYGLLFPGGSFLFVHNYVGSNPYSSSVTYRGQESVTVPAGTYTACKFEETTLQGGLQATWVIKGKGVIAKYQDVGSGASVDLLPTSRLNGQPF